MYLFKVTLYAKKTWMDSPYLMSWAVIADTADGAIEQVMEDLDLTGVEVEKVVTEIIDKPILLNIKEFENA